MEVLKVTAGLTRVNRNVPLTLGLLLLGIVLVVPGIQATNSTGVAQLNFTSDRLPASNGSISEVDTYECPTHCSCHYDPGQQHLKISCRKSTTLATNPTSKLQLTNGVLRLGLNHVTLDYFTINALTLHGTKPKLNELDLHHVQLDPVIFLTSDILKKSVDTLRKLRICNVELNPSSIIPDSEDEKILSSNYARLHLDSLSICNSPPQFSTLLLSALPSVAHVTMFNASVTSLNPTAFSHLGQTLQTLNLSHNEIHSLPWGLFSQLPKLTTLDLSHNHLQHLQEQVFAGLESVRKLDVSYNRIKYADMYVFTPLISLHFLDLSQNQLLQIFEPYFEDNVELRTLLMRRTWAHDSFLDPTTATRSLTEMDKLIDTLQRVETLDLRDNEMMVIPESLAHLKHLKETYLSGNSWSCSCKDRWLINWLATSSLSIDGHNDTSQMICHEARTPFLSYIQTLNCKNPSITARTPRKYYGVQGKSKTLKCHPQKKEWPRVRWTIPRNDQILQSSHETPDVSDSSYTHVLSNGDLFISNLTANAFGLYTCVAEYPDLNITHFIHLGIDTSIFLDVKLASIVIGWLTSAAFLMTVLTIQFVRLVLSRYGIDCPNIAAPYKARRVKRFFESMDQHKNSQLEWLRDNYNLQVKRVKDNCTSQVERIRESYTVQTKNLSDIRDYGAQQIQTVREQYHDQIRRVSSYSTQQLCKVRENYVFQRNRVGKFSSHQLLRLRETYKWQAQTVNKILENLPKTLNFDSCRGVGVCGRTDSIYLDDLLELSGDGLFLDPHHLDAQALLPLFNPPQVRPEHVSVLIPSEDMIHHVGGGNGAIGEEEEGQGDSTGKANSIKPPPSPIMVDEEKEECDNGKEDQFDMDNCVA